MAAIAGRRSIKAKKKVNLHKDEIRNVGVVNLDEALEVWSKMTGSVTYNTFQSAYYAMRQEFPDPEVGNNPSRTVGQQRCLAFFREFIDDFDNPAAAALNEIRNQRVIFLVETAAPVARGDAAEIPDQPIRVASTVSVRT